MVSNLKDLITLHEGRVSHAYQDSLGYWTIGVGHLIDKRKGGKLPERVIDDLLEIDIESHSQELLEALPWVRDLDEVRLAVLIDMTFNLGIHGLLAFKKTLAAIKDERWEDAKREMLDSRWADQVGRRAERLADMMLSGQWPNEVFVGPY